MMTGSFGRRATLIVLGSWVATAAIAQEPIELYGVTSVTLGWSAASGPVAGYYVLTTRNDQEPTVSMVTVEPRAEIAAEIGDAMLVHVAAFDTAGVAGPLSPASPTFRFNASSVPEPEPTPEPVPVPEPVPAPEPPPADPGPDGFGTPLDFTGDGVSDIVLRDAAGALTLWAMNGAQVRSATDLPAMSNDWAIVGNGDYDGNGGADFLWEDGATGRLIVWLMRDGAVDQGAQLDVSALDPDADWSVGGSGDFDGDGQSDVMLLSRKRREVAFLYLNGTQVIEASALGGLPSSWTVAATDDFDGDGMADVVWHDSSLRRLKLWRPTESLAAASDLTGRIGAWRVVGSGDFDGDGHTDLIARHESRGHNRVWRLKDGVRIDRIDLPDRAPGSGPPLAVADYDGDLRSDLLWADGAGSLEIWFSNGTSVETHPVDPNGAAGSGDVVVGNGSIDPVIPEEPKPRRWRGR